MCSAKQCILYMLCDSPVVSRCKTICVFRGTGEAVIAAWRIRGIELDGISFEADIHIQPTEGHLVLVLQGNQGSHRLCSCAVQPRICFGVLVYTWWI